MTPQNSIPGKYGKNTEPTGKDLPQLKDPINGQWPNWETHPNEYVSQIMPTLYDAADKRLSKQDLRDAIADQFNTRLENLDTNINKPLINQFEACWVNIHGVTPPQEYPKKKSEVVGMVM